MKTRISQRRAISTIIATILVVALTLVAAVVLYGYWSSTASRAQNTAQITVSADVSVPGGSGPGTFVITITNGGSVAMTNALITSTPALCSPALVPAPTAAAPVAPGSSTSGSCITTASITSGTQFSVVVQATFEGGATSIQTVVITAH